MRKRLSSNGTRVSVLIQTDPELDSLLNGGIAPLLTKTNDFKAVAQAAGFQGIDELASHFGWKSREDILTFFTGSANGQATTEESLQALGHFYALKARLGSPS